MNFREMRARLIGTYGRFVFFPDDPESPKLVSTKAFTHLVIEEESITLYAPKAMEEQVENELRESYDVVYGDARLKGAYHISPGARAANIQFQWLRGDEILKKAMRKPFEDEMEIIKDAGKLIEKAMDEFWNELKIGISEREASAKIDAIMREAGIEGFSYPTVVVSGEKSRFPVPSTGNGKIEEGKIVYIDVFPIYEGYPLNFSRVVFTEHRKEWISALESLNRMYESLASNLRPGTSLNQLDSLIRAKIGNFPHYSIVPAGGFYQPLAPGDGVLEENMLLTVVPSIYLKDGVIRVKQSMLIECSGPVVLF